MKKIKRIRTCWAVIPTLNACLKLSLVRLPTTMLGNLYKRSENKANKLICKWES